MSLFLTFVLSIGAIAPCTGLRARRSARQVGDDAGVNWYERSTADIAALPFNFKKAYLAHSNLGGLGPDDGHEHMTFANVGSYENITLEMVITVADGTSYDGDTSKNILDHERLLGQINLKCGTATTFRVELRDMDTHKKVKLPRYFMTIFDIDAGSIEGQGSDKSKNAGIESNTVGPLYSFYVDDNTELDFEKLSTGSYSFKATQSGKGADNPTDPYDMTAVQRQRAVMVEFRDAAQFYMTMEVSPGMGKRNMLFGGPSAMLEETYGECTNAAALDLGTSSLVTNDLQSADGIMFFEGALTIDGTSVDLTVESLAAGYTPANASHNGLTGDFGVINVEGESSQTFRFSFTQGKDKEPYAVTNLFFSFFDIDSENTDGAYEELTINTGAGTYFLSKGSTLVASPTSDGDVSFRSSTYGSFSDNPTYEDTLSQAQFNDGVTLSFHDPTSSFDIGFVSSGMTHGRNFAFGGSIELACGM